MAFVDVEATGRQVDGYARQCATDGFIGQRGSNVRLATLATASVAPVVLRARLPRPLRR